MTINRGALLVTKYPGLHNFANNSGSFVMATQTITTSPSYFRYPTQSFPSSKSNPIANILINISTLETTWRTVPIFLRIFVNGSTPVHWVNAGYTYALDFYPAYTSSSITLTPQISNHTGGTLVVPALTINYKMEMFLPPY